MLRTILSLILATLLAGFAIPAAAQGPLKVNVPFDFQVGRTLLPAGQYVVILSLFPQDVVMFRNIDNPGLAAVVLTHYAERPGTGEATAVFTRYADTYLLTNVWKMNGSGHEAFNTKAKRALMAKKTSQPETKTIAMKTSR